jgi:hypothetical protein
MMQKNAPYDSSCKGQDPIQLELLAKQPCVQFQDPLTDEVVKKNKNYLKIQKKSSLTF